LYANVAYADGYSIAFKAWFLKQPGFIEKFDLVVQDCFTSAPAEAY